MNTNQVMPMARGVHVSRKASVMAVRDRGAAQGKNDSFDDVLAKSKHNGNKDDSLTLQDVKDLAKSAEAADKESKLAEAVKSAGTEAETPKNTKNGETTGDKMTSGKEAETAAEFDDININVDVDINIDIASVAVNPLSAVAASHDIDGEFVDDMTVSQESFRFVPKEAQNYNLQTILPQSGEANAKHTEMLQMLSGQLIPKNQDTVQPKNLNSSDMGLAKMPIDLKAEGISRKNPDMPQFVQKIPTDPLSAMASNMAKVQSADVSPAINADTDTRVNLGANVNESIDAEINLDANVKVNVNPGEKINVTAENQVDIKQNDVVDVKTVLADKPKDIPVIPETQKKAVTEETKADIVAPKPENLAVKAQPFAQGVIPQDKNATQSQGNNPLAGLTVEVEDGESVEPVFFQDFAKDAADENNSGRQPFFDKDENEVFRMTDNFKNSASEGRGHIELQTFASHIEAQNNANATQNARESTPLPQMPRDDFNVRNQIVEQARLIRQENGTEMVIRLKPEHLGNLTLRISVSSEGSVTASFFTNNHEVRSIVENSLVQLRQELQNQGLKVDKTEVYAGLSDGSLPQGQGQEAWQQNGRGSSRNGFRNSENDAVAFEEVSTNISEQGANIGADDRVDYLV